MTDEELSETEQRARQLLVHQPYDGKLMYSACAEIRRLRGMLLDLGDTQAAREALREPCSSATYDTLRRELKFI